MHSARITEDFSQNWRFHLGDADGGERVGFDDDAWEHVVLPHSWNAEDTFIPSRGYYRGKGWYRKRFMLSEKACAGKVFIEFGAAFAVADVWVNEEYVGQFMGGFTGFCVDATEYVDPGENLVAVALDNAHDPDVLPGKEIPDYNLYGGLYREVTLACKDRLHIPQHGIAISTPTVSRGIATLSVGVIVRNERPKSEDLTCTVSLCDHEGKLVMERREAHQLNAEAERLILFHFPGIRNLALWAPSSPYLYSINTRIEQGTITVDNETVPMGFRSFEFTRDYGFTLNGEPLKLRGVNRHQDYPGLGNALPRRLQIRDAEIIKDMGGNFVRTSHYPQHPVFLDACDRLGILVYEEIASWQYIGGEQFVRNAEAMLRQMIARDKNHPSIILWGLLNEGRNRDFFGRLNAVAHRADPTRPTVYAENHPDEGRELTTVFVPDVLGINYKLPHIDDIREALPDLRLLSSEHTNADNSVRGDADAEIAQLDTLKTDTDIIESRPYLAGGALWSMHDYGTDYEPVWPVQWSGVLDAYRIPKAGFHYLKCRWRREPMLYFCGHWTWPGQEGQWRIVTVVNNCDYVELLLNGRSFGVRKKENPARWEVPYEPGTLTAIASRRGKKGQKTLSTAGEPTQIRIAVHPGTIRADGSDVAEVTVWVADGAGTTVPCAGNVHFAIEGPAVIRGIGGQPVTALAEGLGRILVQATSVPGDIRLVARYEALPESAISLVSQ